MMSPGFCAQGLSFFPLSNGEAVLQGAGEGRAQWTSVPLLSAESVEPAPQGLSTRTRTRTMTRTTAEGNR